MGNYNDTCYGGTPSSASGPVAGWVGGPNKGFAEILKDKNYIYLPGQADFSSQLHTSKGSASFVNTNSNSPSKIFS